MKKKRILANLQRHREKLPTDPWEAENLFVGCVQTLEQAGQRGFPAWLDRKGRRAQFRKIQESFRTKRGQKALRDLIDLTISAVGACAWIDDYWVGALHLEIQPWELTEARKAALAEGRAKFNEWEKAQKEQARKPPKSA